MSLKKLDFHNGCPYQTDEGLFYNVADVEPILNSSQQLKAEIRTFLSNSNTMSSVEFYKWIGDNSERLRDLSAV